MIRWIILLAFSFTCIFAHAFKVEPMSAEMSPIGKGTQMKMRIENTSSKPLTVELYPLSMTMNEYGKETITPADDDLLVIPVTAIIQPGSSQSIMVRYLGDPSITVSKAYRIAIKQVAIQRASEDQSQVHFLLQFNTLINVRPKNALAELTVKSITQNNDKNWVLEIINSGNSYGRLTKSIWRVSDGNNSTFMKGTDIAKLITGTLILPNSTRFLEMKPIKNFNSNNLSIEIEQDD